MTDVVAAEGLMGLLSPAWQAAIAFCLLGVLLLGLAKLARRGPTRMTNAMVVTAMVIVVITALTVLAQLL
ncbi:hypothetical protein [Luedemannella helvata]|uniref:Uncharacterized protein n=1 Tax=Luedemannella helvata TaxID=349315 RepID=A0ABN2L968_9ACTN